MTDREAEAIMDKTPYSGMSANPLVATKRAFAAGMELMFLPQKLFWNSFLNLPR